MIFDQVYSARRCAREDCSARSARTSATVSTTVRAAKRTPRARVPADGKGPSVTRRASRAVTGSVAERNARRGGARTVRSRPGIVAFAPRLMSFSPLNQQTRTWRATTWPESSNAGLGTSGRYANTLVRPSRTARDVWKRATASSATVITWPVSVCVCVCAWKTWMSSANPLISAWIGRLIFF